MDDVVIIHGNSEVEEVDGRGMGTYFPFQVVLVEASFKVDPVGGVDGGIGVVSPNSKDVVDVPFIEGDG